MISLLFESNMRKILIKNFKQISAIDTKIAGGKGASLGEMTQAGIPVPGGFVILSDAFDRFLTETDLNIEIEAILNKVDIKKIHTIENAAEKIQAIILSKSVPDDIKSLILKYYKNLESEYVAVRSSATAEDSISLAWAGQLDTFLNTTENNIVENVKKCWASLFTPRAIFYRFENKLNKNKISVAVIVQKMIQAEKSGIAFSVHPVTQDRNQAIVEAGFGLGEAIVSGAITPDSYVVNKQKLSIIDINVNQQKKALYKKDGGGNYWRDIAALGKEQVLSKKEIIELCKLIIKIEKHYNFPCDIEWVYEKGKFYIVQSRPITTLTQSLDEYRKIMTRPQNLIDCECWDIGERLKLPEKFKNLLFFDPLFIYNPGKAVTIYYNFTDPKQNLEPLLDFLSKNISWLKKEKIKFDSDCLEIRKILKNKSNEHKRLYFLIGEIWPMIAVCNVFGSTEYYKVPKELKQICIQVRNESDDVLHPAISYLTQIISDLIPNINFVNLITYSEFVNNLIPDKKELEKRKNGWLYHDGKIIHNHEKYFQEKNIQLSSPAKDFDKFLKGNVACKGLANGKVKLVFELSDLKKIQDGDIIVTPMTTPEMVPVLKKVSAIITDEGGITCHAAIISRELKIPCIIGTLIATQVLKNNDLIKVNANQGFVKIVLRDKVLDLKNFSKQISYSFIPVICFESAVRSYVNNPFIKKLGIKSFPQVIQILTNKFESWDDQNIQKISDKKQINFLIKAGRDVIKDNTNDIDNLLSANLSKLSNADLIKSIKLIDKICTEVYRPYLFFIHEYFKTDDKDLLLLLPDVRMELSDFVSKIYVCCDKLINSLSEQYPSINWQTFTYSTFAEIINLLKDKYYIKDFKKINGRLIAFVFTDNKIKTITDGKKILDMKKLLESNQSKNGTDGIKGNSVFPGVVKGRVIKISVSEYSSISKILKNKKNYILVTPMTRPEFVPFLKNAKAIVTDEGGLTCHAAIVARELKKPCIVGTGVATANLKNGDMVEVDANQGFVRLTR